MSSKFSPAKPNVANRRSVRAPSRRLRAPRLLGLNGRHFPSLRTLHDLRHSAATKMAENDVPEATMNALLGRMSRSMLERYSHIRTAAKREAVAGVTLRQTERIPEAVPVEVPVVARTATIQ